MPPPSVPVTPLEPAGACGAQEGQDQAFCTAAGRLQPGDSAVDAWAVTGKQFSSYCLLAVPWFGMAALFCDLNSSRRWQRGRSPGDYLRAIILKSSWALIPAQAAGWGSQTPFSLLSTLPFPGTARNLPDAWGALAARSPAACLPSLTPFLLPRRGACDSCHDGFVKPPGPPCCWWSLPHRLHVVFPLMGTFANKAVVRGAAWL